MKIFSTKTVLSMMVAFLLFGCSAQQPVQPIPEFTRTPLDSDQYASSIDNLLVILDASSSMEELYKGNEKFVVAREIVKRMNQTLPELGQNAGLRSFGHSPAVSNKTTVLFYGMQKYSTQGLNEKLDMISKPGGTSPLYQALTQAKQDLKGVSGKTAVVIVSDAKELSPMTKGTAEALKEQLGANLCLYPILVGDNAQGAALMKEISQVSGCGFVSNADDLLTGDGMAKFVKEAFLIKKAKMTPKDSDNDGVIDELDKCPGTPAGTVVDAHGCPLAVEKKQTSPSDMKAAAIPAGATLNAQGTWVVGSVLFDFDKSVIKPEAYASLDKVAAILKANPGLSAKLYGHTDNIGTKEYNDALALRRAQSVKNYLAGKGIDGKRLTCEGFGFSKPVADNKTEKGRALNRRVELHPVK
ncbi:MAG: OmpA family protein [Pseudomonadota bacterium]